MNMFVLAMCTAQVRRHARQCTIPEQICLASCYRRAEKEGQEIESFGCRPVCDPPTPLGVMDAVYLRRHAMQCTTSDRVSHALCHR